MNYLNMTSSYDYTILHFPPPFAADPYNSYKFLAKPK